ncbi:MAG: hypothetical protein LAT83_18535 [Kiritimatiellae bacterium]|nr:hypothetical protein [Kiritimatiellia bacterium]
MPRIDKRRFKAQDHDMENPTVNFEEKIGKTVGRRQTLEVGTASAHLQQTGAQLFAKWGKGMPKGVYRYQSHEEAERDLIRNYVRET